MIGDPLQLYEAKTALELATADELLLTVCPRPQAIGVASFQ
jgi:hypothetical protein